MVGQIAYGRTVRNVERGSTMKRALVLGGGGITGIAWTTGILAGLAESGTDVTTADLILGTSAGANVAAQIGSGMSLPQLLARQADPALQTFELQPPQSAVDELMKL